MGNRHQDLHSLLETWFCFWIEMALDRFSDKLLVVCHPSIDG